MDDRLKRIKRLTRLSSLKEIQQQKWIGYLNTQLQSSYRNLNSLNEYRQDYYNRRYELNQFNSWSWKNLDLFVKSIDSIIYKQEKQCEQMNLQIEMEKEKWIKLHWKRKMLDKYFNLKLDDFNKKINKKEQAEMEELFYSRINIENSD